MLKLFLTYRGNMIEITIFVFDQNYKLTNEA